MAPDATEPADLRPLREHLGDLPWAAHLRLVGVASSTNDLVWELARRGAPEGTTIVADAQSGGRGRQGRQWFSAPGLGLYVSTLLRPPQEALSTLWTLAAGIAACEACRHCGVPVELDWPNDLVHEGRKLGGVLVEARQNAPAGSELVIGTGINVGHEAEDFPPPLRERASSLRLVLGRPLSRLAVAAAYLRALAFWHARLVAGDTASVHRRWLALAPAARGRRVRVRGPAGTSWEGITDGLDPAGALRVRQRSGEVLVVRQVDAVELREG